MALAAFATKYPDEFALGINIAGVWDFEQWAAWMDAQAPFRAEPVPSALGRSKEGRTTSRLTWRCLQKTLPSN